MSNIIIATEFSKYYEKKLKLAGGIGKSLYEKTESLKEILPYDVITRLNRFSKIRNSIVHEDGYVLKAGLEKFVNECIKLSDDINLYLNDHSVFAAVVKRESADLLPDLISLFGTDEIYKYNTRNGIESDISINDNHIAFIADSSIIVINIRDRSKSWKRKIYTSDSYIVIHENIAYVSLDERIIAYNVSDGSKIWDDFVRGDGFLVTNLVRQLPTAIRVKGGKLNILCRIQEERHMGNIIFTEHNYDEVVKLEKNGNEYAITTNNAIYLYKIIWSDTDNKIVSNRKWMKTTESKFIYSSYKENKLISVTQNNKSYIVECYSVDDLPSLAWKMNILRHEDILHDREQLYIIADNKLRCLNTTNGQIIWENKLCFDISAHIVGIVNNKICIDIDEDRLLIYSIETGSIHTDILNSLLIDKIMSTKLENTVSTVVSTKDASIFILG